MVCTFGVDFGLSTYFKTDFLSQSFKLKFFYLKCLIHRSANSQSHKLAFEEDIEQFVSPQFIHKPRSLDNLIEGQNAHFEAKLEPIADPNLRVEWFLDGRPVTIGHRFRPIHDFGYVALDIVGLISEDSGTYTCRATNNVGSCECQVTLNCKSKFFKSYILLYILLFFYFFIYPFILFIYFTIYFFDYSGNITTTKMSSKRV